MNLFKLHDKGTLYESVVMVLFPLLNKFKPVLLCYVCIDKTQLPNQCNMHLPN